MKRPLFEIQHCRDRVRPEALSGLVLAVVALGLTSCDDATAPGGASHLDFAVQPVSTDVGSSLALGLNGVAVVIQDDEGHTVPEWTEPVTLSLASGPAGALTGTTTAEPVAGTAIFHDLRVTEPGSAYQLVARSGGLEGAASQPFDVHALFTSASVTSGNDHTCALTDGGTAYCWGANAYGQLGDGTGTDRSMPVAVQTDRTFTTLSAGALHTCGMTETGAAFCWGYNGYGQVGTETTETCIADGRSRDCSTVPRAVDGGSGLSQLAAGSYHTCGLSSDGEMACWGSNVYGQLGVGEEVEQSLAPMAISGGRRFLAIDAGYLHSCGLQGDGRLYCWGSNIYGEVGDDSQGTRRFHPVSVLGERRFVSLSAGGTVCHGRTCAITEGSVTYCWGRSYNDLVAGGRLVGTPSPLKNDPGFETVVVGGYMVCGLTAEGVLYCWGEGRYGRLGTGSSENVYDPAVVFPEKRFVSVSSGSDHTCAVTVESVTYCWGSNEWGQLGRESPGTGWTVPVPVWR